MEAAASLATAQLGLGYIGPRCPAPRKPSAKIGVLAEEDRSSSRPKASARPCKGGARGKLLLRLPAQARRHTVQAACSRAGGAERPTSRRQGRQTLVGQWHDVGGPGAEA